jgi:hypothetical protein
MCHSRSWFTPLWFFALSVLRVQRSGLYHWKAEPNRFYNPMTHNPFAPAQIYVLGAYYLLMNLPWKIPKRCKRYMKDWSRVLKEFTNLYWVIHIDHARRRRLIFLEFHQLTLTHGNKVAKTKEGKYHMSTGRYGHVIDLSKLMWAFDWIEIEG